LPILLSTLEFSFKLLSNQDQVSIYRVRERGQDSDADNVKECGRVMISFIQAFSNWDKAWKASGKAGLLQWQNFSLNKCTREGDLRQDMSRNQGAYQVKFRDSVQLHLGCPLLKIAQEWALQLSIRELHTTATSSVLHWLKNL
jgi:hypothetical protein